MARGRRDGRRERGPRGGRLAEEEEDLRDPRFGRAGRHLDRELRPPTGLGGEVEEARLPGVLSSIRSGWDASRISRPPGSSRRAAGRAGPRCPSGRGSRSSPRPRPRTESARPARPGLKPIRRRWAVGNVRTSSGLERAAAASGRARSRASARPGIVDLGDDRERTPRPGPIARPAGAGPAGRPPWGGWAGLRRRRSSGRRARVDRSRPGRRSPGAVRARASAAAPWRRGARACRPPAARP